MPDTTTINFKPILFTCSYAGNHSFFFKPELLDNRTLFKVQTEFEQNNIKASSQIITTNCIQSASK